MLSFYSILLLNLERLVQFGGGLRSHPWDWWRLSSISPHVLHASAENVVMQFRLRTLLIVRSMRFSLRMLLLLVTVVCCVSAYGVNWHRQRDQFLKEQVERSRTMIRANHIPLFAVR